MNGVQNLKMKSLILAAGRGNRLSDKTNNINKCMLKLNEKPILEYNVQRACEIDEISEIIIVVGYQKEDIIKHFGFDYNGKSIRYIYQWEQTGLVGALEIAKDILAKEDFLLLLGDEILINSKCKEMVKEFNNFSAFGLCGVVRRRRNELEKISKTYSLTFTSDWRICRVVEKPKYFPNIFQGVGCSVFKNKILDYIDETPIDLRRGRQEKELPGLIQCAIDSGELLKHFVVCSEYFNINTEQDLIDARKILEH